MNAKKIHLPQQSIDAHPPSSPTGSHHVGKKIRQLVLAGLMATPFFVPKQSQAQFIDIPHEKKPLTTSQSNTLAQGATPFDSLVLKNMSQLLGKRYGYIMKDGTYAQKLDWKVDWKREKSYTGSEEDCDLRKDTRVNCISYLQYVYDLENNPVLSNAWATICDRDHYPSGINRGKTTLKASWDKNHIDIIVGTLFDWVYSGKPFELGLIDENGNISDKKAFLTEAVNYLEWYEKYLKTPLQSDEMEILGHDYEIDSSEKKLVTMKFPQSKIPEAIEYIRENFLPTPGMTCHMTYQNSHTGTLVNEGGKIMFYNAGAIGVPKGVVTHQPDWYFGGESLLFDLKNKSTKTIVLTVSGAHTANIPQSLK